MRQRSLSITQDHSMLIRLCHCPSHAFPYGFRIQSPLAWLSLVFLLGFPFASIDCVVILLSLTFSFLCHHVCMTLSFLTFSRGTFTPFPCLLTIVTMTPIPSSLFPLPPTGSFQFLSLTRPSQWLLLDGPTDYTCLLQSS